MKLIGSVTTIDDLNKMDRDVMFALMDRMYANMHRDSFEQDLNQKRWVIRLDDPISGRLVGFSTQTLIKLQIDGISTRALFSGDTVVDHKHWGDTALASTWGKFVLRLIDQYSQDALYWFLISKGFRTYRYLPLFFKEYYPCSQHPTHEKPLRIMKALANHISPQSYDEQAQVIRAGDRKEHVRTEFGDASRRTSLDSHVRFFTERNPNYHLGDELCCLAPLTRDNFTPLAWRMIRSRSHAQSAS